MKLSLITVKNTFRKWFTLGVTLLIVSSFSVVFAQDDQDIDPAAVEPSSTESSTPVVGSGPWGNTTTTTVPSRGANSTAAGANGTAARPVGGSTTLDLPGGPPNPDVPFDTNMNIAFLVVGLVFAFVVYKKRFAVKSEPLTK